MSKNSDRIGRTDKLKNTRILLKWEMQQQMSEASSKVVICSSSAACTFKAYELISG